MYLSESLTLKILPIIFYSLPFKIWSLFNSFINFSLKFFWINLRFSYHFSILVFSLLFVHKLSWDLQVEGWGDEIFLVNAVRINGQGYWHWRNTYFYNYVIQVLISLWSPEARTCLAYNVFINVTIGTMHRNLIVMFGGKSIVINTSFYWSP